MVSFDVEKSKNKQSGAAGTMNINHKTKGKGNKKYGKVKTPQFKKPVILGSIFLSLGFNILNTGPVLIY